MSKYSIGLDLGINNVGWAKYDYDNKEIVDKGVVRFQESSDAQERRSIRGSRRLNKRAHHRVERLAILFKKYNFNTKRTYEPYLLEKRIKGLKEKLEEVDITNIMYYFSIHRGYIPFDDEKSEREVYSEYEKDGFQYPCEYLQLFYNENKKYRGISKLILLKDNLREIKAILELQKQFNKKIDSKFIEEIIDIISSKRKFYEGPGGLKENQLTKYGRYRDEKDLEIALKDKSYRKYLYETLIGKCNVTMEQVAPKMNFYAEEFNFLNDFINTTVKDVNSLDNEFFHKVDEKGHLKVDTIKEIRELIFTQKTFNFEKLMKQVLGVSLDDLQGYRIDKNYKPNMSSFQYYRYIRKQFENVDINPTWLYSDNKDNYNKIIYVLTVAPSSKAIEEMLKDRYSELKISNNELEVLKKIKQQKKDDLKYHALSEKLLITVINDMYKYNCEFNFMQLLKKLEYDKETKEYFQNNYSNKTKQPYNIEDKYIDELIANPQVKKTLRKAIKIINKIMNDDGDYPKTIVIESAKEVNGKEKRSQIEKDQKNYEKRANEATTILINQGIDSSDKNIQKVIYWLETNGQCAYCGKDINITELLNTEIEHILPKADSMDDSNNNKTCSCNNCNKSKGKQTPYYYLSSINMYEKFKDRVINIYKDLPIDKKANLLYEGNISKYSLKFINRNLRDNAFASVALVNELNKYNLYLNSRVGYNIDVVTMPGQITSKIRRNLFKTKEKDRNYLYHHAVDAMILASVSDSRIGNILINSQNDNKYWINNNRTEFKEEIVDLMNNGFVNLNNWKQIQNFNENCDEMPEDNKDGLIKRSYEVRKNPIKQFSDVNYIKYIKKNDEFYKISKISNIYGLNINKDKDIKAKLDKLFDKDNRSIMLLCEEKDPKLFDLLKGIYEKNNTSDNPFVDECKYQYALGKNDEFNYLIHGIRKNDNKKSAIVKSLRYLERVTNPYLKKDVNCRRKNLFNEFTNNVKKENTYVGLNALAQVCTRIVYSKNKNRFIFIPLNAISYKNNKLDEENFYYQETYNRLVGNDEVVLIGDIHCGEWIKVFKKNESIIEGTYSYYHKTSNAIVLYKNGIMTQNQQIKFVTSDKRIIIYSTDILGNHFIRVDSDNII